MAEDDGALRCAAGNMALSRDLQRRLEEAMLAPAAPVALGGRRGSLFCPRCAGRLAPDAPDGLTQQCSACGLRLDVRIMHALIELHPHEPTD